MKGCRRSTPHWRWPRATGGRTSRPATTRRAAPRAIREEGVAVARQVGDKSVLSQGLEGLAPLYWLEGNLTAAEAVAAEALLAARAIGSVTQIFLSLLMLVGTACLQHALAK